VLKYGNSSWLTNKYYFTNINFRLLFPDFRQVNLAISTTP